jgi:transposase
MDSWVKDWLEEQHRAGKKCLEIKVRGDCHYVYRSTSRYDKKIKKGRKVSVYLGKLDKEYGFIPKGEKPKTNMTPVPRSVTDYGNSMILHNMMEELKPLLMDNFPEHWEELYAMSIVRVNGYTPLKRIKDSWEDLYDPEGLKPNLNPSNLSKVLREVGLDRFGQNEIFNHLKNVDTQLVYDLSTCFSRSMNILQAEKGYNKDCIQVPQINFALLCGLDSEMPTMIKSVPGSVRDISTLYKTIEELDISDKVLLLDRGFFSEKVLNLLEEKHVKFVLPTKRNSHYYDTRIHLNEEFIYHDRLIKCGKRKLGNRFLYLYEDQDLRLEEQKTIFRRREEGKISDEEYSLKQKRAGKFLIISNYDIGKKEMYELYKKRDSIEKLFDAYKTTLDADKLYLHDDESVYGHVFVAFLSLYAYCKLLKAIKKAEINDRFSPADILLKFRKVKNIDFGENNIVTEVPKKVRELDKTLLFNIFPTKIGS